MSPASSAINRRTAEAIDPVIFARSLGIELDQWQQDVVRPRRRQTIILCTRQAGKSYSTAVRALHKAEYKPGSITIIGAPGERQAGLMLEKIKALYTRYPGRRPAPKWNAMSVEFRNGSTIIALPGNAETVRGFSDIDLLILDEASRIADAFYQSVRPMLAVSGGELVILSTPWGKRGFYYQVWTESAGSDDWHRIGPITARMVPRITEAFLAEERRWMPTAIYEQEYLCKFTDQIAAVFLQDQIALALSDGTITPLFPESSPEPLFDPAVTPLLNVSSA